MHNIALLQKLTKSQLKGVLKNDPLMQGGSIWAKEVIRIWQKLQIEASLIDQLLFSCAEQMIERKKHGIAFDFLKMYDHRLQTHYALSYGVKVGSFHFISTSGDVIEWKHLAKTAENAIKKNDLNSAINCYGRMKEQTNEETGMKVIPVANQGINKVLHVALRCADLDIINRCLDLLGRKLTQPEIRILRGSLVNAFKRNSLDDHVRKAITEHCAEVQRRECLNYFAKKHSFGHAHLVESYAKQWQIPLSKKHMKFMLSRHWYTEPNGGNAGMRVDILRKLVLTSKRYELALRRALENYRQDCINYGEIVTASKIGDEIGESVTIEEFAEFLHSWGADERYQKKHVPFAIKRMVELVNPKSDPKSKEPDFGVHTFS